MPETFIAGTGCFILLTEIDELSLLQRTNGELTKTPGVANEFGDPLP